jgi:hypothetical protein
LAHGDNYVTNDLLNGICTERNDIML